MHLSPHRTAKDVDEAPWLETEAETITLYSHQTVKDDSDVSSLEMKVMTSISPHRMVNDNGDGPFLETKAETMPLPSRQMVKDDGDIPLSETEVNMHLSPHLTVKNNGDVPVPCIRYRDIDRIYLIWCYKI